MNTKILGVLILSAYVGACSSENPTVERSQNPLGELVECDDVIEEVVGVNYYGDVWRRRRVAYVPVEDPLTVRITRCDLYYYHDGESIIGGESPLGTDCYTNGGDFVATSERPVTFTSDFEVEVECEVEESTPSQDGVDVQRYGGERTYVRTSPLQRRAGTEDVLGAPVECDERIVEDPGDSTSPKKVRQVAYVPVADPGSVTITRCGWHRDSEGVKTVWNPNCVAETEVEFTPDSRVLVECGTEHTYPVGLDLFDGQGGVDVIGYEEVYIREDPGPSAPPEESPFGAPIECDEVVEWENPGGTRVRYSAAYLPVEDPMSVVITRCGAYGTGPGESTYRERCVSSKVLQLTPNLEVFVDCESQHGDRITGYSRIYYQED